MIQKLFICVLIGVLASVADAGLHLDVGGMEWDGGFLWHDINIVADDQPANVAVFLLLDGGGALDISGATNHVGDGFMAKTADLGLAPSELAATDAVFAELVILHVPTPNMPNGPVVAGIKAVSVIQDYMLWTLRLVESDSGAILEEVEVFLIPEPASVMLLGLGGLLLRRRK